MAFLLQCPNYELLFPNGPVVFLAGPVQGAPNWQSEAFNFLLRDGPPNLNVANPRRATITEDQFQEQVDWESNWLTRAGREGVILFWLAAEKVGIPGRSYAQTSRFELGEWFGRAQFISVDPLAMPQIVVGIEDGFPGANYIRYRIRSLLGKYIPVLSSLEETCKAALDKVKFRETMLRGEGQDEAFTDR